MEYVSLGRGGPTVSAVGLGMWQAGGKAWGADVRDADCRKAIERAVDLGINLVDTAEAYGDGFADSMVVTRIPPRSIFLRTSAAALRSRTSRTHSRYVSSRMGKPS